MSSQFPEEFPNDRNDSNPTPDIEPVQKSDLDYATEEFIRAQEEYFDTTQGLLESIERSDGINEMVPLTKNATQSYVMNFSETTRVILEQYDEDAALELIANLLTNEQFSRMLYFSETNEDLYELGQNHETELVQFLRGKMNVLGDDVIKFQIEIVDEFEYQLQDHCKYLIGTAVLDASPLTPNDTSGSRSDNET